MEHIDYRTLPIVFLHGFLGNASDWKGVCSYLSDYSCICLDLPGHGNTPFSPDFDIPFPYFHLVGYSMGGRIALRIAKHKIASLTLLSTHPGLQTEQEKKQRWQSDLAWANLLQTLSFDQFLKKWYAQPIFQNFRPKREQPNVKELVKSFLYYSLAKQPYTPLDHVLVGERDEKFRKLFPHPVLIPNAAHAIHLENPKQVACILTSNIKKAMESLKSRSTVPK